MSITPLRSYRATLVPRGTDYEQIEVIPQHSHRRFFVVKLDGQEYTDLHSTTQQAATDCAFGHNPEARSIVVKAPR